MPYWHATKIDDNGKKHGGKITAVDGARHNTNL
jgi:hypothetical protein